jgi:pimeloyl-ACP methyl ester carboxylesterase
LALVSSQIAADAPERKEGRYKTAADVEEKGVGIVAQAMTDKLSASQSVRDVVRPLIERQSKSGVVGALKAMAEREDMTASVPSFKFPMVLLHGDADELISVDRAREVKAILLSAQLVELPGAGHLPMMEMPAKTADVLRLFK